MFQMGQKKEALEHFRDAAEIDPDGIYGKRCAKADPLAASFLSKSRSSISAQLLWRRITIGWEDTRRGAPEP